MDEEIRLFTGYLEEIKKLSRNTVMSYHGDLTKMAVYMKEQGITSTADIRGTTLNAYVLHMEKKWNVGGHHFPLHCFYESFF